MTHRQLQPLWCLIFSIISGALVAMGSNWWLGGGAAMALFTIHNIYLAGR